MTQDIIEIAEACGFTRTHTGEVQLWLCNKNDLERLVKITDEKTRKELREEIIYTWVPPHFVDLAVKEEREACAKVCDDIDAEYEGEDVLATWCSKAIRARGEA
jgi:hypothetical protein